ncbi:MAG: hypothetical protein J5732_05210 [Bacteroidaceae bacterium]|nr:hypothetical protein [Bacteroidaceae bacterium]
MILVPYRKVTLLTIASGDGTADGLPMESSLLFCVQDTISSLPSRETDLIFRLLYYVFEPKPDTVI